mmetsp:Transcript_17607/g.40731  ORF Transcript_17607/g.40731 Transcript_17607/m.40731 type:complete len:257 (-) Transcript_17607:98-868(-)
MAVASAGVGYTALITHNSQPDHQHTVYHIKVASPEGREWEVQKRYREFRELHDYLRFHISEQDLPQLPGKRYLFNNDPSFIATRQAGLQSYLDGLLALSQFPPELRSFLGVSCRAKGYERRVEGKKFVELLQRKLLNLTTSPTQLEPAEMQDRLDKYGRAMKLHVLSQPVDPINLRSPGFDHENIAMCATNSEQFESLLAPPSQKENAAHAALLTSTLDKLHEVLRTDQPLFDASLLVVDFAPLPERSPQESAVVQ